eukprot:scaffold131881_cov17-Tisochrysis_lutea.AAC.1
MELASPVQHVYQDLVDLDLTALQRSTWNWQRLMRSLQVCSSACLDIFEPSQAVQCQGRENAVIAVGLLGCYVHIAIAWCKCGAAASSSCQQLAASSNKGAAAAGSIGTMPLHCGVALKGAVLRRAPPKEQRCSSALANWDHAFRAAHSLQVAGGLCALQHIHLSNTPSNIQWPLRARFPDILPS